MSKSNQSSSILNHKIQVKHHNLIKAIIINDRGGNNDEARISSLKQEIEMWKAKYFASQGNSNGSGFEDLVKTTIYLDRNL